MLVSLRVFIKQLNSFIGYWKLVIGIYPPQADYGAVRVLTGSCGGIGCEPRVLFASLNTVANVLNANANALIAETREMGLKAFVALCNIAPVKTTSPVLANVA